MPNDCPYCEDPYLNFVKCGVEMRIDKMEDGKYIISAPYMWSIPINFCPFCRRKLRVDSE